MFLSFPTSSHLLPNKIYLTLVKKSSVISTETLLTILLKHDTFVLLYSCNLLTLRTACL
jgi:hypothetical protein